MIAGTIGAKVQLIIPLASALAYAEHSLKQANKKEEHRLTISAGSGMLYVLRVDAQQEVDQWISSIHVSAAMHFARSTNRGHVLRMLRESQGTVRQQIEAETAKYKQQNVKIDFYMDEREKRTILQRQIDFGRALEALAVQLYMLESFEAACLGNAMPAARELQAGVMTLSMKSIERIGECDPAAIHAMLAAREEVRKAGDADDLDGLAEGLLKESNGTVLSVLPSAVNAAIGQPVVRRDSDAGDRKAQRRASLSGSSSQARVRARSESGAAARRRRSVTTASPRTAVPTVTVATDPCAQISATQAPRNRRNARMRTRQVRAMRTPTMQAGLTRMAPVVLRCRRAPARGTPVRTACWRRRIRASCAAYSDAGRASHGSAASVGRSEVRCCTP